jgi:hypothetical protein
MAAGHWQASLDQVAMIAACFAGEALPENPYAPVPDAEEPEPERVVSDVENEKAWLLFGQMLKDAVAAAR